jgi:hypothetical protein
MWCSHSHLFLLLPINLSTLITSLKIGRRSWNVVFKNVFCSFFMWWKLQSFYNLEFRSEKCFVYIPVFLSLWWSDFSKGFNWMFFSLKNDFYLILDQGFSFNMSLKDNFRRLNWKFIMFVSLKGCHCNILQSNSVITNSTGPSIFVRYNRDIVITVKLHVVKSPTKNFLKFCSL